MIFGDVFYPFYTILQYTDTRLQKELNFPSSKVLMIQRIYVQTKLLSSKNLNKDRYFKLHILFGLYNLEGLRESKKYR